MWAQDNPLPEKTKFRVTHARPLTDSWVAPLFELVRDDEAKTMNPNAADLETETNCTLFVMQA